MHGFVNTFLSLDFKRSINLYGTIIVTFIILFCFSNNGQKKNCPKFQYTFSPITAPQAQIIKYPITDKAKITSAKNKQVFYMTSCIH